MSFREDRLKERVEEVRPGLEKAREIAELAESENRAMTDEEQKIYDEGVSKARERRRRDEAVSARPGGVRVREGTLRQRHRWPK